MRYFTFKKVALAHKAAWQRLRFLAGKGYFLVGKRPSPAPVPTVMYDDINLSLIPKDAQAVAGYVGGQWPTFSRLRAMFPGAKKRVSIAVSASEDADILDIENGDATNAEAAAWFKRQQARGAKRPGFYTSVSNVAALIATLTKAGIARAAYVLWTAHYTDSPHLCGPKCYPSMPTTAEATQYTSHALGRSLDASVVTPAFFNGSGGSL